MKLKAFTFFTASLLYSMPLIALVDSTELPKMKPVIDPLSGTNIFQMVGGLLLVLFIVILVAWLVRRVGGVTMVGGGVMSIIGGMSMGARERVVLLQVGEEQLLIGLSPGRIQKLHVLKNPIDIQPKKIVDNNFANKLSEVLRGKSK